MRVRPGQEVGLEIRALRFEEAGRYLVAVVATNVDGHRFGFVSREASKALCPDLGIPGLRVDFGESASELEVTLAFHRDVDPPLARDPSKILTHSVPVCVCRLYLGPRDALETLTATQVRMLTLMGDEMTGEGTSAKKIGVLTLGVSAPRPDHIALLPIDELHHLVQLTQGPRAGDSQDAFSVTEKMTRLHAMNARQSEMVRELALKMEHRRAALDAAETHEADLKSERFALLEENEKYEKALQQKVNPVMTDLDMDLMLALPGGWSKVMHLLACADERARCAQDEVVDGWNKLQEAQETLNKTRPLVQRIADLEAAGEQQLQALKKAEDLQEERERIKEVARRQEKTVKHLQNSISSCGGGAGGNSVAKLAVSRERATRDELREALARLEMSVQKPSEGAEKAKLEEELRLRSEKVTRLVDALERHQFAQANPRISADGAGQQVPDKIEAIEALQMQHESLQKRCIAVESQLREVAVGFAKEISKLKVDLADRDALVMELERRESAGIHHLQGLTMSPKIGSQNFQNRQ